MPMTWKDSEPRLLQAPHAQSALILALPLAAAVLLGSLVVFAEAQAVIVAVSLLACVFVLLDFRFGVACLVVLMPLSASSVFPHGMAGVTGLNPLNLLLVVTLAALLLRGRPPGGMARFAPRPVVWLYVVPVVLAGLMGSRHVGEIPSGFVTYGLLAFTDDAGYLRDVLLKPLLLVPFALLVGAAAARSRQPERFVLPMMLSVWMMAALTLAYVWQSGASLAELSSNRERGFFAPLGLHANDLGRYYVVAYALMLFTAAATQDLRLRGLLIATMAADTLALMLTFSRSAFLGFAIVNVWFLFSRRKASALLLGGLLLAALAALAPGAIWDRIADGWDQGLNAFTAGRVSDIWLPLLPEIWKSPLYGSGLDSTLWSAMPRLSRSYLIGHPHNAYLRVLLDMGIVGVVLLGAYFVHVWRGFRRLAADAALSPALRGFFAGAAAGLGAFLILGLSGSGLSPSPEQVYLWFAIGMMYGLCARSAERADAER